MGLSKSQVSNILTHSHARNNRAVLFNFACAMIIHITDMLIIENSELAGQVSDMHRRASEKQVSVDGNFTSAVNAVSESSGRNTEKPSGHLYKETTELVSADIISCGRKIRELVIRTYGGGCNGKHFVSTVLFSCLLPTIGFHVLSRTGHSNLTDTFWFKQIPILHSTTHLKYQELSLFYAFFVGFYLCTSWMNYIIRSRAVPWSSF